MEKAALAWRLYKFNLVFYSCILLPILVIKHSHRFASCNCTLAQPHALRLPPIHCRYQMHRGALPRTSAVILAARRRAATDLSRNYLHENSRKAGRRTNKSDPVAFSIRSRGSEKQGSQKSLPFSSYVTTIHCRSRLTSA